MKGHLLERINKQVFRNCLFIHIVTVFKGILLEINL